MPDAQRCRAHSSRTGEPCKRWAILGGTVCTHHGGNAPQTKAAALARIEAALPTALERIIALTERADSDSVRLRAAEMLLDRNLGKVTDKLKLSGDADEPLEIVIARPTQNVPTDSGVD